MKIKTITCHNVYNYGASLQAYSLMKYLQNLGHDVEIIDYMPKYITDTLSLWAIGKKWNNNIIIKSAFYSYVVPVRLLNRKGRKKFDLFTKKYLNLTPRYKNFQDLCLNPPQADIYFTGSDQIWNTNIKNGLDPAFYLKFVPTNKIKASYAASFSISEIPIEYQDFVQSMLAHLDAISVREKTGLNILQKLNITQKGVLVVDPVFLLSSVEWKKLTYKPIYQNYILIYDQENNSTIRKVAKFIAKNNKKKIVAFKDLYPRFYADYLEKHTDPIDFISLIAHADMIITNSFHCTAFSIIFEKNFCVIPRTHQQVNSRMSDLLEIINCSSHLIKQTEDLEQMTPIDYSDVKLRLETLRTSSYQYINSVLNLSIK